MSVETSEKAAAKKASKTPIWLFPSAAEQVFAGYSKKEQSFIFGCVTPAQTRDITYWPGNVTKKDVPIPPTVLLQYMPIFYGEKAFNIPGTEIQCSCKPCTEWYQYENGGKAAGKTKPRTKLIHFGRGIASQFGMYEFIQKKKAAIIRRLAMGNNKHSQHPIMQSLICWNRMKRPINLLEAYSSFWRSYFSFSYTGKEKGLDNPDGYEAFLENYVKISDEVAKICGDIEIDLGDLLQSLDPLLLSDEKHYGVSIDIRGFPRKIPKVYWVDKDEKDNLLVNGKRCDNAEIRTANPS